MTNLFSWSLLAVVGLSGADLLLAQADAVKAEAEKLEEARSYPAKTYDHDRMLTGPSFRMLRTIRAGQGNAAAAAQLTGAWQAYFELRQPEPLSKRQAFDEWGFWVWHEAQFDSGKNDPEWALLLYRSIYDLAKQEKWQDWVTHVRPQLIRAYGVLCQWAQQRALSNEAEDYFAGIGFDLDPKKLPEKQRWSADVPFVSVRKFPLIVPNSQHVVYWQRKEEKDASKPTYLDNLLTGLIGALAWEDTERGQWDRAVERFLWLRDWSDAVKKHNADNNQTLVLKRDHDDIYRRASFGLATVMSSLGYREKALAIVEEGLARKGASNYDMIDQTRLEIMRDRLLVEPGQEDAALLARMDEAIAREGKSPAVATGNMDSARFVKAACLITLGKSDDAEALLKSVCDRNGRKLWGWMAAELELLDLLLARRQFDKAEKTLKELVVAVRITGVKKDELDLYRIYVKWAMLSGNWEEALRAQREVMRLLEAFRMTPLLPLEQARLSRILAELGNRAESSRLAVLAKSALAGRDEFFVKSVEQALPKPTDAAPATAEEKVRMQPSKVVSMALEKFPTRAVVSLVNHGSQAATGTLKVKGLPARISWDQASGQGIVEVEDVPGNSTERVSGPVKIEAGSMAIFSCSGKLPNQISKTVILEWSGAGAQRCEWLIEAEDKQGEGAVIDAAEYQDDPFFLIPVYHHLQSKGKGPVNLRVVTSQPCRVEMYDGQGTLQMVDAEGNGSLENSGDWLGTDRDRNLAAEVLPEEATGETRFLLQLDPMNWKGEEPLRIRVEWLVDGKWFLAAEDQIVTKK